MKCLNKVLIGIIAVCIMIEGYLAMPVYDQDAFMRERVVKLIRVEGGSCSGVIVKGWSGRSYILTAAHCKVLKDDKNRIVVEQEDGSRHLERILEISMESDLMLLTSRNDNGIEIRDKALEKHEHIWTMTHGGGFQAYRTDGEALEERKVSFAESEITTEDQMRTCLDTPNRSLYESYFGVLCVVSYDEQAITARIVPGSSGGPILDSHNRLVGIVSAGDDKGFGYVVRLTDITQFLQYR